MVPVGRSGAAWKLVIGMVTLTMDEGHWFKQHLISNAAYTRLIMMGAILLLVMRFAPRGLIPER